MPASQLKINRRFFEQAVKGPNAQDLVLRTAIYVCRAANEWADSIPRSGRHDDESPHFAVVQERGQRRARYTVRPRTAFGTWLVMRDPARFMACLNAGRAIAPYLRGR